MATCGNICVIGKHNTMKLFLLLVLLTIFSTASGSCKERGETCGKNSDCCPRGDGVARTCKRETVSGSLMPVTFSECMETTAPVIIGKNPVYTLTYPKYRCETNSFWFDFKQFSLQECKALCQGAELMMYVTRGDKNCACLKGSQCNLVSRNDIDVYTNTKVPVGSCVKIGGNCRYNSLCCPSANGSPRACTKETVSGSISSMTFMKCVDTTAQTATQTQVGSTAAQELENQVGEKTDSENAVAEFFKSFILPFFAGIGFVSMVWYAYNIFNGKKGMNERTSLLNDYEI